MTQIAFGIYIFLDLLSILVIIDVVLSWMMIFGLNLRPKFLADIIEPIYKNIKKIIPTSIGPLDFTPIIIIMVIAFLKGFLLMLSPDVSGLLQLYKGII